MCPEALVEGGRVGRLGRGCGIGRARLSVLALTLLVAAAVRIAGRLMASYFVLRRWRAAVVGVDAFLLLLLDP